MKVLLVCFFLSDFTPNTPFTNAFSCERKEHWTLPFCLRYMYVHAARMCTLHQQISVADNGYHNVPITKVFLCGFRQWLYMTSFSQASPVLPLPLPVPNKELQRANVPLLVGMWLLLRYWVLFCFFANYLTLFYSWTVRLFPKGSANSVVLFYQGNFWETTIKQL